MKKKYIYSLLTFMFLLNFAILPAKEQTKIPVDAESTATLKNMMGKFGTLMGGIQVSMAKDKEIDWDVVDLTLKDMDEVLKEMQKIDKNQAYKPFTDLLATGLADLKIKYRKKNKDIYEHFDKLTETCFQCHALHRPADFLFPKHKTSAKTP